MPKTILIVRIGNFPVDGFDERTQAVYEYHGCFWHKHFCQKSYDPEVWEKTLERKKTRIHNELRVDKDAGIKKLVFIITYQKLYNTNDNNYAEYP